MWENYVDVDSEVDIFEESTKNIVQSILNEQHQSENEVEGTEEKETLNAADALETAHCYHTLFTGTLTMKKLKVECLLHNPVGVGYYNLNNTQK